MTQQNKQTPRIKRATNWLNKHKFIATLVMTGIGLIMFVMGAIGMYSFIMEEVLQMQGFGYAIPMMSKQWDDAYGAIQEEKPHMRRNAIALRRISKWNPITGGAFKAFASASIRKLDRDIAYIDKMREQEGRERYAARTGR